MRSLNLYARLKIQASLFQSAGSQYVRSADNACFRIQLHDWLAVIPGTLLPNRQFSQTQKPKFFMYLKNSGISWEGILHECISIGESTNH